jgi:hypothetical protein
MLSFNSLTPCTNLCTYLPLVAYSREALPATAGLWSLLAAMRQQAGMQGARLPRAAGQREDISLGQVEAAGADIALGLGRIRRLGIERNEAEIVSRPVRLDQRRVERGPV